VLDGAGKAALRSSFEDLKIRDLHPMENEEISSEGEIVSKDELMARL
jgi:hypothetical protein